jgi:hypothetical protein
MKLRWRRILLGVLVAEVVPIVVLVAMVAVSGSREATQAQAFAASVGRGVGPVGGAILTFIMSAWAGWPVPALALRHGLALGGLAAAIDLSIILAAGTPFELLFGVSNAGRVIAGALGGQVAATAGIEARGGGAK